MEREASRNEDAFPKGNHLVSVWPGLLLGASEPQFMEILAGQLMVGIDSERLQVFLFRAFEITALLQHQPKIVVGIDIGGIQPDRFPVFFLCIGSITCIQQNIT